MSQGMNLSFPQERLPGVEAVEEPHSRGSLQTTLVAKGQLTKLVEVQGGLNFHRELENFARWLAAQRQYAELYIATSEEGGGPGGCPAGRTRGAWVC